MDILRKINSAIGCLNEEEPPTPTERKTQLRKNGFMHTRTFEEGVVASLVKNDMGLFELWVKEAKKPEDKDKKE